MTMEGRTLNAEPLTINVEPARFVYQNCGFVDINQDGYPEKIGYVNDGKGNLEKVLLSYVTNLPSGITHYLDYNMDGYPDAIIDNNVYINTGEQDNDFELETQNFDVKFSSGYSYSKIDYSTKWFDANNDGYLDNCIFYNDGTNIVWRPYTSGTPNYDVNRDGFLDIVTKVRDWYNNEDLWYVLYKDSTTNINYSAPQLMFKGEKGSSLLDDINNDGYVDILIWSSKDKLSVVKGSATLPYTEVVTYDLPVSIRELHNLYDYNNDGYLDLGFEGYEYSYDKNKPYLFSFGPDFTGELVEWTNGCFSDNFMVQKDGGYPAGYLSNIKNLPPSAPATVAAKQTKDGLLIAWSDAQDDHTPAMQMRYNVSVKRKGKKGDNSFVISPMNGLKDAATICGTVMYKKSTQMIVPASVLTAGETYEIQVQAIDLWNQHSPMTSVVEFTMAGDGYIEVAEQVAVGKETSVKFVGTQAANYSLNAGSDATIVEDQGNGSYIVKWNSAGVKDITLTAGTMTVKSAVTVVNPVDLTFSVAGQVFAGAPLSINVSDDMAAQPKDVGMRIVNNNKVKVDYIVGSKTATVTFPSVGTYELEAYSTDPVKANSYKQTVEVSAEMPEAVIEQVDVDSETGYYAVNWNADALPEGITKVVVEKEGSLLDAFHTIATFNAAAGRYVDNSSTPAVKSSRYRIRLLADNGQESSYSNAHKPLHVMIAKAANGFNLIWDSYEGMPVQSYNIMRGSSADNLQQIDQVAGSINSYTDMSAPSGISYYAVTFNTVLYQNARGMNRAGSEEEVVKSNVISTEQAIDVVEAQHLEIIVLDDDKTLSEEHQDLQLYHLLLPTYATIAKVNWEIVQGSDIATIDANGRLHATGGSGTVTVRLSTIDGSGLSADIDIPCTLSNDEDLTGIYDIQLTTVSDDQWYDVNGRRLATPQKGLNILRKKDGTTRKVVIK